MARSWARKGLRPALSRSLGNPGPWMAMGLGLSHSPSGKKPCLASS